MSRDDIAACIGYLALCLFVAAILIGWPFALIWALNVLFGLDLPFGWRTWLAAFILDGTVRGIVRSAGKKARIELK